MTMRISIFADTKHMRVRILVLTDTNTHGNFLHLWTQKTKQ